MPIVKRVKPPPPGNGPAGPPAVHYATAAAPAGNVTGWTADRAGAREFSEDEADAVLAHYAARPEAGRVTTEPAAPPARKGKGREAEGRAEEARPPEA